MNTTTSTATPTPTVRWYRGVIIEPKGHAGYYSARIDIPGGGVTVRADTLRGIKAMIRDVLTVGPSAVGY